jgi:hypothetical protein
MRVPAATPAIFRRGIAEGNSPGLFLIRRMAAQGIGGAGHNFAPQNCCSPMRPGCEAATAVRGWGRSDSGVPQSPVFCGVSRRKKCAQILFLKNSSFLLIPNYPNSPVFIVFPFRLCYTLVHEQGKTGV